MGKFHSGLYRTPGLGRNLVWDCVKVAWPGSPQRMDGTRYVAKRLLHKLHRLFISSKPPTPCRITCVICGVKTRLHPTTTKPLVENPSGKENLRVWCPTGWGWKVVEKSLFTKAISVPMRRKLWMRISQSTNLSIIVIHIWRAQANSRDHFTWLWI